MHAELMDFNVTLQQTICSKDVLIEKMKTELEELRGPINENLNDTLRPCINVWIPSAFLTGNSLKCYLRRCVNIFLLHFRNWF